MQTKIGIEIDELENLGTFFQILKNYNDISCITFKLDFLII